MSSIVQRVSGVHYKWIALSNTTLGVLMATINASIMLIALPDIFRGIGVNPLQPGNTSLLLWLIMGYLVVTAVLVVSFGRLGDMFGRVRMFNLGFALFALFSIMLSVTWLHGTAAAWWLIGMRVMQGVGGAMLMANSSAILTDAFPANERGLALGLNQVAAIAGSFIGLVLGGILGPVEWRLVFLVSVPFGVLGAIWSYLKLQERGIRRPARLDWAGNLTFGAGLIAVLVGITYGIQPYGGHTMGWTSPLVLGLIIGGLAVLRGVLRHRDQGLRADVRPRAVQDPPVHRGQHGQPAVQPRPRRPHVHADHLAAGHLPADARLRLRPDPAVGRHRDAAADCRLPVRRPAVRLPVRPFRRPALRHWRHAAGSGVVPAARDAADQLHLLAVRRHPAAQRHRNGPVRLAEPGRHHEQPAA